MTQIAEHFKDLVPPAAFPDDTVIEDLVVKEDAKDSEIQLGDGTKIEKADVPKDTVIDGEGTIDKKVVDSEKVEADKPKPKKKPKKKKTTKKKKPKSQFDIDFPSWK